MCWRQPEGSGAETGISSFGLPQHCWCKLILHIYKRKQAHLLYCFTLYSSNRPISASFKGFLSPLSPNPVPSASPKQSGALLLPSRSPDGLPLFPRKIIIIIKMIIKIATKRARPGRGQVQPRRALGGAAGAAMAPGRGRGRGEAGAWRAGGRPREQGGGSRAVPELQEPARGSPLAILVGNGGMRWLKPPVPGRAAAAFQLSRALCGMAGKPIQPGENNPSAIAGIPGGSLGAGAKALRAVTHAASRS